MNKAFLKSMDGIKKQKAKEEQKQKELPKQLPIQQGKNNIDDDLSSNEQKRLKELGVFKKKIHKDEQKKQSKWKRDNYKTQTQPNNARPANSLNPPTIIFEGNPGYNKIFPIVKHLKIYIREIDDKKIVFNEMSAFLEAKKKYVQKGLLFKTSHSAVQAKQ